MILRSEKEKKMAELKAAEAVILCTGFDRPWGCAMYVADASMIMITTPDIYEQRVTTVHDSTYQHTTVYCMCCCNMFHNILTWTWTQLVILCSEKEKDLEAAEAVIFCAGFDRHWGCAMYIADDSMVRVTTPDFQ